MQVAFSFYSMFFSCFLSASPRSVHFELTLSVHVELTFFSVSAKTEHEVCIVFENQFHA